VTRVDHNIQARDENIKKGKSARRRNYITQGRITHLLRIIKRREVKLDKMTKEMRKCTFYYKRREGSA